jgi:ArsR family metal-binding transcriptional regulator
MKRPQKTKAECSGCSENFYNGNNDLGVQECWSFKSAKILKRKKVPLDQCPPWKQPAAYYMSCRRERGYVFINGDRTQ